MTKDDYRFRISKGSTMHEVEETLLMAVIAAEGIHGRAQVRLDGRFNLDPEKRLCTINSDNKVGEDIAKIFAEFLRLDLGEEGFRVGGPKKPSRSCPSNAGASR